MKTAYVLFGILIKRYCRNSWAMLSTPPIQRNEHFKDSRQLIPKWDLCFKIILNVFRLGPGLLAQNRNFIYTYIHWIHQFSFSRPKLTWLSWLFIFLGETISSKIQANLTKLYDGVICYTVHVSVVETLVIYLAADCHASLALLKK